LNNLAYILAPENPDEALKYAQQAGEIAPDEATVADTLWLDLLSEGNLCLGGPVLAKGRDQRANPPAAISPRDVVHQGRGSGHRAEDPGRCAPERS